MDETVVKRFAPFTPLAKPLGPLDPMPVFEWKEKIEPAPDYRVLIEGEKPMTDQTERSNEEMTTLYTMMKLVENATTVRIDLNGEEMVLTPHRLAMYGDCRVKQIFVNIESELEMELEER